MRKAPRPVGSMGLPSRLVPHRRSELGLLGRIEQLGGPYQRRAALVVIIFVLAVEALEAFRGLDLAGRHDRAHRTRALAQMTRAAAFGTALEQIEEVQPIERCEHTAER